MANTTPKVLVSGSGIAGAVFASWLLRAFPSANITIVERAPSLRLTGASVDIRSTAVKIIKLMGAEAEIRRLGTGEKGTRFVRSDGSVLAEFGSTGREDVQSMTSEYEIHRGALANVFMSPILSRVNLIYDESVARYTQSSDQVHVKFSNGKQDESYDLLIAADGLGSRIRGQIHGVPSRQHVTNSGVHCAFFTVDKDLLDGEKFSKWYNAVGGRGIFLRPDPHPDGRVRGHFITVTPPSNTAAIARWDEALQSGDENIMTELEKEFHDAGWLAKETLAGMRRSTDFYASVFAQVRTSSYVDNRVALLGDAGYATPGIGTSLAIMGAHVLAGELARSPDNLSHALSAYQERMMPFVKKSQWDVDWPLRALNPQSAWGLAIRNAVFRVVYLTGVDKLMTKCAGWFGGEAQLELPDYPWVDAPEKVE